MLALRSAFPRDQLREDVRRLGSIEAAAERAGVSAAQLYAWIAGRVAPRAERLETFLTANEIPVGPYLDYLARATPTLTAVCSLQRSHRCRRQWNIRKGDLAQLNKRRRERGQQVAEPQGGRIQMPCAPCTRAEIGRRALKQVNDERFEGFSRAQRPEVVAESMGGQDVLEANWKRFRKMIRKPKSEAHRARIGAGHVRGAHLRKGFRLCHLCELLLHDQHRGRICHRPQHWHRVCLLAFRGWFSKTNGRQPRSAELPVAPHVVKPGPNPEKQLLRNFKIAMLNAQRDTRAVRTIRKALGFSSRATVVEARKTFIRYMPGSLDLVFSKTATIRRSNSYREILEVSKELEHEIRAAHRDPLIRRLHAFGMRVSEIGQVTGAAAAHIIRVTATMSDGDHEQARLEVLRRCGVRTAGADVTPIPEAPKGVPSLAPNIKLGEDEVRDILGAPAERGVIARLARKHNVTPAWVSAIRKGRTRWTRATGPLLAGPQSGPDVVGRLG